MRQHIRRPATFGGFLLLLNVVFLLLNGVLWSRSRFAHQASQGSGDEGKLASSRTASGGEKVPDDFYGKLMAKNSELEKQVRQLRRDGDFSENDVSICQERAKILKKDATQCRAELKSAKLNLDELQREVITLKRPRATGKPAPQDDEGDDEAAKQEGPSKNEHRHDSEVVIAPSKPRTPWLLIGIPTIGRRGETGSTPLSDTLLFQTLTSMEPQITGPSGGEEVKVLVLNNRPGKHPVFERVKQHYKDSDWVIFQENNRPHKDDAELQWAAEFEGSTKEQPTDPVRRQTLDVVSLLDAAVALGSQYYFFTEDDFAFCDNTLLALRYMIQRADEYEGSGQWAGIRCSFGLNGIIMHNQLHDGQKRRLTGSAPTDVANPEYGDLAAFRDYLLRHFNRRPPDHLVVEWYAKESQEASKYFGSRRRVMAFRYNVVNHLGGRKSTLRSEEAWSFPGCFTELIAPQVFVVEAWNPVECPDDDLWPCDGKKSRAATLVWSNKEESHVSKKRKIFVGDKKKGKKHAPGENYD